jgi:predicted AAA+ superfamily ATPase
MKRLIDHYLLAWKTDPYRKALIIRGARQVGKTYAMRQLGKTFEHFVEVNFESSPKLGEIFKEDLDPTRILLELAAALKSPPLVPGKSLLFFDEIQMAPNAITALRYFYEKLPELHIAAAGSLLDFAIQRVGIPVGRVQSLYMYPMSFIEFLGATKENFILNALLNHNSSQQISVFTHNNLLKSLGHYLAIGGMPKAIEVWITTQNLLHCASTHQSLLSSYRQDFYKYAKTNQIDYLTSLFESIPLQLGKKFKYSEIEGNYRSRELSPGLELLCTANVAQKVWHSAGNGVPLGAQKNLSDFKVILVDIGLSQALLGLQLGDWILNKEAAFVNKGELVEAFVGQEMLVYTDPLYYPQLYYWNRHRDGGSAELDYLLAKNQHVIPVEVKSGKGSTLKSMHLFLEKNTSSPYGVRFSTQNYSLHEKVHSYPLYAIAQVMWETNKELRKAIEGLM